MREVIIVAGGKGKRMGAEMPKQFLEVDQKPIIVHTIHRFRSFDATMKVIVVLPEQWVDYFQDLAAKFNINCQVAIGGAERFQSVQNGLKLATADVVAVHDAVRPLVSIETLRNVFDAAESTGAAIPVIALSESLRRITENGSVALNRSEYRLVQTPQVFRIDILKSAYQQPYNPVFTDDASVVEAQRKEISLVAGNVENIKITTPADLQLFHSLLRLPD
ncbi:MAG: 2-C-methyl-D-erythritol 4-phosphate cytidylyltransferase [Cryomorphaceae bacterium]|nr:2-C-methyl-D-erythritol 4-phosphate cytidylyltransferase [Cryomorphaceae bacterium]